MTRDDITAGLAEILEEVAGVSPDDVAEEKSFTDDLDVDSLSMVEVVVAAEEKFGVKIPDDEVQNLKTVGERVSLTDVVVTGLGATTPLGGDVASTWDALVAGRSGVSALTQEWAKQLPVRIAAQLAVDPAAVLDRVKLRRLDRSEAIALIAAHQAWDESGLAGSGLDSERLAVSVGSGIGGAQTLLNQDDILEASGARKVSPHTVPMLMPNGPAAWIGLELRAQAGVHSVASACATGAEAIAQGLFIIRSGRADVVVAGGTEAVIHPLPIAGFASMRAMSTRNDEPQRASRPFDKARDGFVLGEGAAIVVLERADHAAARGAHIYARLAGAGLTSDGYDIVQPDPAGRGGTRAITAALRDAGVANTDIVHVNAHATSTPVGDIAEISMIHRALGNHPVLTAPKSMTGHLLGAAGALESIATILAIYHGVIPPTVNLDDPDDAVDLDVVAGTARQMDIPAALNNSFGFGGHNVALVFTRS
jgi:3-oxoacyl-[acyl-carrier-protein] synthase II